MSVHIHPNQHWWEMLDFTVFPTKANGGDGIHTHCNCIWLSEFLLNIGICLVVLIWVMVVEIMAMTVEILAMAVEILAVGVGILAVVVEMLALAVKILAVLVEIWTLKFGNT